MNEAIRNTLIKSCLIKCNQVNVFLHTEWRISSILLGKVTIFKKAILKPLSLGIELRVSGKLLILCLLDRFLEFNSLVLCLPASGSTLTSHSFNTPPLINMPIKRTNLF